MGCLEVASLFCVTCMELVELDRALVGVASTLERVAEPFPNGVPPVRLRIDHRYPFVVVAAEAAALTNTYPTRRVRNAA